MLDNQLISAIIGIIVAQAVGAGIPGLLVKQAYQPTMQGVSSVPMAYLTKLGDKRIGFPSVTDKYDSDAEKMIHTELQQYETIFQIGALVQQDPQHPEYFTASDVINLVAHIMQSQVTVTQLEATGVGILRIGDIRNPYFEDDRGQQAAFPSFDFTLTHKQVIVSATPVLQKTEFQILTV